MPACPWPTTPSIAPCAAPWWRAGASASPSWPRACRSASRCRAGTSNALRWPSDSTAELTARGPAGATVDVRFTLGARGNRSQVGVDFGVAEQSDDARVKAVVSQLVALLRGPQPAERPTVAATIQ